MRKLDILTISNKLKKEGIKNFTIENLNYSENKLELNIYFKSKKSKIIIEEVLKNNFTVYLDSDNLAADDLFLDTLINILN